MEFDFGQNDKPEPWTIESINARLAKLKSGEVLRIEGLPNEIYHGCDGVSCSKLKVFIDECPYEYYETFIAKSVPFVDKPHFKFGEAGHTKILEPDQFDKRYAVMPPFSGTGSMVQKERFEQRMEQEGKKVLSQNQWDAMPHLRRAIDSNPIAKKLTSGGVAEVSFFKLDEETGLLIKCRPDYIIDNLIIDLKTCDTVKEGLIDKKFKSFGYHIQDQMYLDITGLDEFCFVAVKSKPPYTVNPAVDFDDDVKRLGYMLYRKGLRDLKQCIDTGVWPMQTKGRYTIKANKLDKQKLEELENEQ